MKKQFSELTCGDCYRCCTTNEDKSFRTPLLMTDKKEIPNYIDRDINLIAAAQDHGGHEKFSKVIPEYIPAGINGNKNHGCNACKWLGEKGLCSQYEKRPFICKQYPFHFVKVNGQLIFGVVTNNCQLGQDIVDGVVAKDPEFLAYAFKNYKEGIETMTQSELDSMADYAQDNYPAMTVLNMNWICSNPV
jgi:Fe-S-cluster containining protein